MAKVLNYSAEETKRLVDTYKSAKNQEERTEVIVYFANLLNKNVRKIIAKLSSEKVYVKPEKVTKSGGEVVRKEELATRIAVRMGAAPENFDSLAKANKTVLLRIITHVANLENNILALEKEIAGEETATE